MRINKRYAILIVSVLLFVIGITYFVYSSKEGFTTTVARYREVPVPSTNSQFETNTTQQSIPVLVPLPNCKSLEQSNTLDEYLQCCDTLDDNVAYCETTDSLMDGATLNLDGNQTSVAFGNCADNGVVTKNREMCKMIRTGKFLKERFSNSCTQVKNKPGMGWCVSTNKAVPVDNNYNYKYQHVINSLGDNELRTKLNNVYGCGSIINPTDCTDPCVVDPNSLACKRQKYFATGGTNSGNFMEGFETQNTTFFDNITAQIMDVVMRIVHIFMPPNMNEGFSLNNYTEDDFKNNLNTIKNTRNYNTYNTAWNNFAEGQNKITYETDNGTETIHKKSVCDIDENTGDLYFNNPIQLECYKKAFLNEGCTTKGLSYPSTQEKAQPRNMNTYKSHVGSIYENAHKSQTQLSVSEINDNFRKCYGVDRIVYPMAVDEKLLSQQGWVLTYHDVLNHTGKYKQKPRKRQLLTQSTISFNANKYFLRITGYIVYPKNCRKVQYLAYADDGVRLFLNDKQIITSRAWKLQAPTSYTSHTINVPPGNNGENHMDKIRIEMYEWYGRQKLAIKRIMYDANNNVIDEFGHIKPTKYVWRYPWRSSRWRRWRRVRQAIRPTHSYIDISNMYSNPDQDL